MSSCSSAPVRCRSSSISLSRCLSCPHLLAQGRLFVFGSLGDAFAGGLLLVAEVVELGFEFAAAGIDGDDVVDIDRHLLVARGLLDEFRIITNELDVDHGSSDQWFESEPEPPARVAAARA